VSLSGGGEGRKLVIALSGMSRQTAGVVIALRFRLFRAVFSVAVSLVLAPLVCGQGPGDGDDRGSVGRPSRPFLPSSIRDEEFSALRQHSPFLRTVNISGSLILTGLARIEDKTVATMLDPETRLSYTLSEGETNREGWELVEVKGDPSDVETLTARVKLAGSAEVISIRYGKAPPPTAGGRKVAVSHRIGDGSRGGGTGPHGGPDPRVLTPDQFNDAREGARDIQRGFQADGYPNGQPIPPEVVSKLSRLSVQQREGINVQMFEYRNRGLGMPERRQIYNRLIDRQLQGR